MADLLPLFKTLVSNVRTSVSLVDVSFTEIEDALSEGVANSTALEILQAKRRSPKFTQVSDEDFWRSLASSLIETANTDDTTAPAATQTSFDKLIEICAAQANRRWLVAIPVTGDGAGEIVQLLSTASVERVFVTRPANQDQLKKQFAKAGELFGITSPLPSIQGTIDSSLLIVEARGTEALSLRQALRSLNVSRDASRLAVHLQDGRTNLDPAPLADEQSSLTDVLMLDVDKRKFQSIIERNIDTSLGTISLLNNAKVRAVYDTAARILEACPEDTPVKNQINLIWRLARSIRVFSRAVGSANADVRYLLMIVALETLLNRADAPMTESFSEYGALIAATGIESRVQLVKQLKAAYNLRSKFVHEGRLPSEQLDQAGFAATVAIVFRTWTELMKQLLPLGEARVVDAEFFARLVTLKFGASFEQAFKDYQ